MPKIMTANNIRPEELLNTLRQGKATTIHFIGVAKGESIFIDKKSGKICLAKHHEISCLTTDDEVSEHIKRLLKEYNRIVLI
ncbi:MAG: hypothetical protein ABWW69_06930 [Pyrodictiaceae archaeon]